MHAIKTRFFGRQRILQDLVEGLLAPTQPLDFSLVGPKLVGKSRLLTYLASEEGPLLGQDPAGWRPQQFKDEHLIRVAHYNCEWPDAQAHLTRFIYQRLRSQLENEKNLGLDWSSVNAAASPGLQIEQIVQQINQKQLRLVLILDNFDRVFRSETITPDIVNELRPLTNEIGLVVATDKPLHDLNKTIAASPLFNVMHQHFVGLLEPDAARAWVDAYQERLPLTDEVKTEMLDIVGGHPFLLARINDILMEMQPLVEEGQPLGKERLPLLRLRLTEHGRRLFEMNWRKFQEPEGQVALPLVKQLAQSPIRIGQVPTEQGMALNWLINQAMVAYGQNHYRLFSPLFAVFLKEQLDLEGPASEAPAKEVTAKQADMFDQLSPKEAQLLRYFQQHAHIVISIEQLLGDVWNQPQSSPRRVQEAIRRLRNSLNQQTPPLGVIENERGVGYRYIPTDRSA